MKHPGAMERIANEDAGNCTDRMRYGYRIVRVLLSHVWWKVGRDLVHRMSEEDRLG